MTGVFAAVATPTGADGHLDVPTFERLVEFLLASGVNGLCLGGATSEYPNVEVADRKAAIAAAAQRIPRDCALLVGIGAPSLRGVLELGAAAFAAGSRAVLLPMPMFFRYEQHDLHAFCVDVSRTLRSPVLLYDLPDFTNALAPATAITLMRDEEFIVGIKDSSGRGENLTAFARARDGHDWTLLVGHDRLLLDGLQAGWNGTISGVAGFYPELPLAIYRSVQHERIDQAARLQALLDELIGELGALPAPWGIRIGLEARGFPTGPLPLPLSTHRREQIEQFRGWVRAWMERVATSVADD
jgi:4-hydroxy-tetrahydrodipicolinate synthase